MITLSPKEINSFVERIRKLSNRANFEKAYELSLDLTKKHPDVLIFAYYEAVMTAEDVECGR